MENNKAIYKLNFDCGRQGSLTGTFVAEKKWVDVLVKHQIEVYWGEVLGKHSEVYGPITDPEITMVSDDPATVKTFEDNELSSGYNPFEYDSLNGGTVEYEVLEIIKSEA